MPFPTEDAVPEDSYKMWIVGSMNKNQKIMNEILESVEPITISKVAGSGNKIVYLLDQKADAYLNLVPGFKYWDMCASEALIQSSMGIVTDAKSKPIIYDHKKENFTIREGIVVTKNRKVHDVCQKRVLQKMGKPLSELH